MSRHLARSEEGDRHRHSSADTALASGSCRGAAGASAWLTPAEMLGGEGALFRADDAQAQVEVRQGELIVLSQHAHVVDMFSAGQVTGLTGRHDLLRVVARNNVAVPVRTSALPFSLRTSLA